LCTLRLPFWSEFAEGTIVAILNNRHDPIPHKFYSDELKDIINNLLIKDPEKRISIQELLKVSIIRIAIEALEEDLIKNSTDIDRKQDDELTSLMIELINKKIAALVQMIKSKKYRELI
jgi:serine/threonine protein kinase